MENPPSTAASSSRNTRTTAGGTSVSSHPSHLLHAASSYAFQPDAAVLERLLAEKKSLTLTPTRYLWLLLLLVIVLYLFLSTAIYVRCEHWHIVQAMFFSLSVGMGVGFSTVGSAEGWVVGSAVGTRVGKPVGLCVQSLWTYS